jgi:hypothetical protein
MAFSLGTGTGTGCEELACCEVSEEAEAAESAGVASEV